VKKKNTKNQRTAHIVSHTHWDREWRYTIWQTRAWLISFMDELLDVLENETYAGFLMDGQVSPVLDYLEVRPEKRKQVEKYINNGRLQIGPWYTLPDEYPVDAEALVRNLLKGRRESEKLGQVFNVGYTSFGWGQIAQLPQIYAQFGMDTAFIGKLVSKTRASKSEFIWKAPDGSELLASRFGAMGRQNFYFRINLQALYGMDHMTMDWEYDSTKHGILYHRADKGEMEQDHFRIDPPDASFLVTITPQIVEDTWASTDESVLENDRLMMNGCDYAASQPSLKQMIEQVKKSDPDKNRIWRQTTMPEFVELMQKEIDKKFLPVVEGELRDGPVGWLTGNALSTRLYLKQLNKRAQNLLIKVAEPLSAIATIQGHEHPSYFLDQSWQYLLTAHPHDSINGVTQDKTARDVSYRLEQVIDIAGTIVNESMQKLIRDIDLSGFKADDILLVVFNPLPYERSEVIEAFVTTPKNLSGTQTHADDMGFLQVYDAQDSAHATQWEGVEDVNYCVAEVHARILPFYAKRHKLIFNTGQVPALGYKVFRLGRNEEIRPTQIEWSDNQACTGSILKSPYVLENEYLRVTTNSNGTINLIDKTSNKEYRNLNYYEDRGEHGTYWVNYKPMNQKIYNSLGCNARIWSEESGPLQATIVSEIELILPTHGDKAGQKRGDNEKPLIIQTRYSLKAGARQVEVEVRFDNQHEDHYLRAMFPTGFTAVQTADAGGHFYVDQRPIRAQGPTKESKWPDMATQPHQSFVDISDGHRGIAFMNDCLTEYEVLEDEERTVALSLLRAVKTWIVTGHVGSDFPSQKGGQCLGKHTLRYAIRPHQGNWQNGNIPAASEELNVPLIPVQTNPHKGKLPTDDLSFLQIENKALRFSALKKAEHSNSFILRLFNPGNKTVESIIKSYFGIKNAWLINLEEKREQKIKISDDHSIKISAAPFKIISLEVQFS